MQTATTNNLFLTGHSSFKVLADLQTSISQGEFYQQIFKGLIKGVYTKQGLNSLGDRLIALAEYSYDLRQFDVLEQASQFLLNWPFSGYKNLGLYYHALCLREKKRFTESRVILEQLVSELPTKFRAKALLAISVTFYGSGDFHSFLRFSVEASRAAVCHDYPDLQAIVTAQRNITLYKSIDGDHHGAVADLERMMPYVLAIGKWRPYLYYEYLNSLAVELYEVGRLEEAQNVSRITLATRYAGAYPEWRETWDDIQVRRYHTSRSVLSLNHSALNIGNVVHMPLPERDVDTGAKKSYCSPFHQQGSVTILQDWKLKMVKQSNDVPENNDKNNSDYTDKELVLKVMEVVARRNFSRGKMLEILDYLETTPDAPPDSESS